MGKSNANLNRAAIKLADESGIKPSRTVKGVRALAASVREFAPRKGSEGRRPQVEKDWETPVWEGPVEWGYVVQGSPKRVISLPDDRPEYWAMVQGEVLLGHEIHGFACRVGEEFELRGDGTQVRWVSRVCPVAVVQRYLRMYPAVNRRLTDHLEIKFSGWDRVEIKLWEWDDIAEDINPVAKQTYGSARELLEFLVEEDYKADGEYHRGRNYR